jgi:hypothetical protein
MFLENVDIWISTDHGDMTPRCGQAEMIHCRHENLESFEASSQTATGKYSRVGKGPNQCHLPYDCGYLPSVHSFPGAQQLDDTIPINPTLWLQSTTSTSYRYPSDG